MLAKLIETEGAIKSENEFIDSLKKEEPSDEYVQSFSYLNSIDDIFMPYSLYLSNMTDEDKTLLKVKDTAADFTGCYISDLNCEGYLERLATMKLVDPMKNRKFYHRNYGVCDNASQAIKYYERLVSEDIVSPSDNFVILLTPIFKKNYSSYSGWRWKKWGPYVGIQNPTHEYIADEPDIDVVFVFMIYQVA